MQNSKDMIDISEKAITRRTATACGRIQLGEDIFKFLQQGRCPKGNVLETAKIAAINAVKATPLIIPMCHNILIDAVAVDFTLDETNMCVFVRVTVKSTGKTGVEIEAITAASVACLTIYDMLKGYPFANTSLRQGGGRSMIIEQIKLLEKTGGKSGDYKRDD